MKDNFNFTKYIKNNILLKENEEPVMNEAATPAVLDKNKLAQILLAATKTKSEYGYPILNKGWASAFMKAVEQFEQLVNAGPENFNSRLAVKLAEKLESLGGGWESAEGKWSRIETATTALSGAVLGSPLDEPGRTYQSLLKYWNNTLCRAVDGFKM
jgi:hypothetical protein